MSSPLPTKEQLNALKDLLQLITYHGISFEPYSKPGGIDVVVDGRIFVNVNNLSEYIEEHRDD